MSNGSIQRRAEPRQRSFIGGCISVRPNASTTECVLRNVTKNGARLAMSETILLPDSFDLAVAHWRETRRAHVVWRKGDAVGVTFTRPEPAASPFGLGSDPRDARAQNAALRAELAAMRETTV